MGHAGRVAGQAFHAAQAGRHDGYRQALHELLRCRQAGVPICNYGMTIAYTLGIFYRALEPFPDALEVYRQLQSAREAGDS